MERFDGGSFRYASSQRELLPTIPCNHGKLSKSLGLRHDLFSCKDCVGVERFELSISRSRTVRITNCATPRLRNSDLSLFGTKPTVSSQPARNATQRVAGGRSSLRRKDDGIVLIRLLWDTTCNERAYIVACFLLKYYIAL